MPYCLPEVSCLAAVLSSRPGRGRRDASFVEDVLVVEEPDRVGDGLQAIKPAAVAGRVYHSARITLRGQPELLERSERPGGGDLLQVGVKPLAVDQLIALPERLTAAVARMHAPWVMHRDICPSNVVISSDCTPCLVGFASATSLAEIRPEFTHHTKIVGTLPYLAPEQTGRTGRSMDQRADLYGLGATLYELAAGEPTFESHDPLRLMHDVVARVPTPPCEVNPAVPEPLSAIIMHLLEKEPDDRYQSADGVSHDLARLAEHVAKPSWPSLTPSSVAACSSRWHGGWQPRRNCSPSPPSSTCR